MINIVFNNPVYVSLWNNEIVGQITDGYWENYRRGNQNWATYAKLGSENGFDVNGRFEKAGTYCLGGFNYNLERLAKALCEIGIEDRVCAYLNIADVYLANECDDDIATGAEFVYDLIPSDDNNVNNNLETVITFVVEAVESELNTNKLNKYANYRKEQINKTLNAFNGNIEKMVRHIVHEDDLTERSRIQKARKVFKELNELVKNM